MLNDIRRNHSFSSAISSFLAELKDRRSVVLDVGAGSGILSLYAAAAGATTVFAVEQDEVVCRMGKSVTAGVGNIKFGHCSSEEFDVGSNHVDLVVSETLDSIGIGEGIVRSCRDLAVRSLNKDIRFIPSQVTLQGFLIHSQTLHLGSFCGNFRTNIGTSEEPYCCEFIDEYTDVVQLSDPTNIFKVKLGDTFDRTLSIISLPVITDGWCDGVCSFLTADLFQDNTITTAPNFVKTNYSRMECWEQGFHPLPRRYVTSGQVVGIKVELTDVSVVLSWVGDQAEYSVVEPSQIKLLNSNFAQSSSNELLNVVPKVVDVSGLVISNPFQYASVKSVSFRGYVLHSKKLLSWSRVNPLALCLRDTSQSDTLSSEVNKYRTLLHENIPWNTLEHTKLSEQLVLLRVSEQTPQLNSKTVQFQGLVPLPPTALVFWTELEFQSGAKFRSSDEPLWRPAAILFGCEVERGDSYKLSVCFSGTSLSASITPA